MNKLLWSIGISVALGSAVVTGASAQQLGLDEGWSIGGQTLVGGESADFTRTFNAGTRYEIVANGSENAQDIDLEILDSRGRLIRQDIRSAKEASVTFSPAYSGRYTIRLKMARASGRALAYFIVFSNDGWNVPMSRVTAAFSRLAAVTSLAQLVDYQIARFYGFVMRVGETHSITLDGVGRGARAAVAVGDDFADDIDIAVLQGGRIIGVDVMYDALPIASFNSNSGSLELRVTYESGSGPSLVLMALLESSPSIGGLRGTGRL